MPGGQALLNSGLCQLNPSLQPLWPGQSMPERGVKLGKKKKKKQAILHINTFFFPKIFIGGKLQNIYSTMFTVTICSELIPQNILQLKLTYLVTFKYLLLSK